MVGSNEKLPDRWICSYYSYIADKDHKYCPACGKDEDEHGAALGDGIGILIKS